MTFLEKLFSLGHRSNSNTDTSLPEESTSTKKSCTSNDPLWNSIQQQALRLTETEPLLTPLLNRCILHPKTTTFHYAISRTISTRLLSSCNDSPMCVDTLTEAMTEAMGSDELEHGHTMADAVRQDIEACLQRDPACESALEVVLFYKGFAALVCHRVARRKYKKGTGTRYVSLWLQSQASAAFGVDIHPAAQIGAGVFFDHATGLVVGETATIGDGCTILHGVTLGGTGKEGGDRHPKVGNDVLIGAGVSILGNIKIGNGAKIGAGSIVLKPIPHGATAVGVPAKVIGWAKERNPGSTMDVSLRNIMLAGGGSEGSTSSTENLTSLSGGEDSLSAIEEDSNEESRHINAAQDQNENDKDDNDHDDDAVDFVVEGTPDQKKQNNEMCAFRSFVCHGMPKGALSYNCLQKVLKECSDDEVGEVFMELLKKNPHLDYIPASVIQKDFCDVVQKYTSMSEDCCRHIAKRLACPKKMLKTPKCPVASNGVNDNS